MVKNKENIVADFFNGSGTTCRVARRLNRHFLGIDINPISAELTGLTPSFEEEIQVECNPLDKVYIGDNLPIMTKLFNTYNSFIDLIYIDPPFGRTNVDKQFGIQWNNFPVDECFLKEMFGRGSENLNRDKKAFFCWLYPRLTIMHKLLKDTGSLYLHIDPQTSHYIKIMLDYIFGIKNFRNEIVWAYYSGGASKNKFAQKHDIIFFYSKSDNYFINKEKEVKYVEGKKAGIEKLKNADRQWFEDENGVYTEIEMRDVWDIPIINPMAKERLGYPTQKPEALLERIIKASSN